MLYDIVVVTADLKIIGINDYDQIVNMLKNNEIRTLEIRYQYTNIISCEHLSKLLESNTSVNKLNIIFELPVSIAYLDTRSFIEDCRLLFETLKINTSITNISLRYRYMEDDTFKHLVRVLKTNNMLKKITISASYVNILYLAKLLKYNKSNLNIIYIFAGHSIIHNISPIVDAMKHNIFITELYLREYPELINNKEIMTICETNKHNIMLKKMMIQDL